MAKKPPATKLKHLPYGLGSLHTKAVKRGVLGGSRNWMFIGFGSAFLALALLRMIQTEWPHTFEGRWMSLLPYLFGLLWAIAVIGIAISRINKQALNKEDR